MICITLIVIIGCQTKLGKLCHFIIKMKGMSGNVVRIALMLTLHMLQTTGETSKVHHLLNNGETAASLRKSHEDLYNITLSEGEQIALEVTYQLLPPAELSQKITEELKLIRYKYRAVSKISHQRKWIPGQLITTRVTQEQIRSLNASKEFGPLVDVVTIDLLPFYIVTTLSFAKPYNPLALGELLRFQYGFTSSPNTVYYDGDDVFYDVGTMTYIFKELTCTETDPANCSEFSRDNKKRYWEFQVSDDGNVRLVKEYEIDAGGNKKFNLKYFAIANFN